MISADQIREHMEVLAQDGAHVGTVDHMDGASRIKLTRKDSADGQHHSARARGRRPGSCRFGGWSATAGSGTRGWTLWAPSSPGANGSGGRTRKVETRAPATGPLNERKGPMFDVASIIADHHIVKPNGAGVGGVLPQFMFYLINDIARRVGGHDEAGNALFLRIGVGYGIDHGHARDFA